MAFHAFKSPVYHCPLCQSIFPDAELLQVHLGGHDNTPRSEIYRRVVSGELTPILSKRYGFVLASFAAKTMSSKHLVKVVAFAHGEIRDLNIAAHEKIKPATYQDFREQRERALRGDLDSAAAIFLRRKKALDDFLDEEGLPTYAAPDQGS